MSVFSLSVSVVSLPRPYLPEFRAHAFLLTHIVCSLVADVVDI